MHQPSDWFMRRAALAAERDRKLDECFAAVDESLTKQERWEAAHKMFRESGGRY